MVGTTSLETGSYKVPAILILMATDKQDKAKSLIAATTKCGDAKIGSLLA